MKGRKALRKAWKLMEAEQYLNAALGGFGVPHQTEVTLVHWISDKDKLDTQKAYYNKAIIGNHCKKKHI